MPPLTLLLGRHGCGVRSAWFIGVLVLMVYLIFAMTLYLLPPRSELTRLMQPIIEK